MPHGRLMARAKAGRAEQGVAECWRRPEASKTRTPANRGRPLAAWGKRRAG